MMSAQESLANRPDAFESTVALPAKGEIFARVYRIGKPLGEGGMGIVFAAEHIPLRRHVAIKILLPRGLLDPSWSARLLREAQANAAIPSQHVVRIIDAGISESGLPYIAMEHLTGRDFEALLEADGRLPIEEAVDYVVQACKALAKAHSLGIIHRDLKPSNLFLTTDADGAPLVKVLDFGISKVLPGTTLHQRDLTLNHAVLGSPPYMSPEQLRCTRDVDARTDIWSLGVVLYELLTGYRPFVGRRFGDLMLAITQDVPAPPRVHRPDLPAGLEALILGCIEKDITQRIQSVEELMRALALFGSRTSRQWATRRMGAAPLGNASTWQKRPSPASSCSGARPGLEDDPTVPAGPGRVRVSRVRIPNSGEDQH